MRRPERFLGGLSTEQFLHDYWQKQPLLCRGALPHYSPPVDAEQLLGLALEREVESRLIERAGWQVENGPFDEQRLSTLPERDWTLLVQDLDQHIPEVGELLQLLDFLPSWRLDDVMASVAAPGGSVGPHFDQYDVFLLQIEGTRRWEISSSYDPSALADSELCILRHFEAQNRWELEPGDLLYLPPRVAHYGVARTPCVTYSLGCRAPSVAEIIGHFAANRMEALSEAERYQDPSPHQSPEHPNKLDENACAQALELLRSNLSWSADDVARGFARLVTQPKALFARDELAPRTESEVENLLQQTAYRHRKGSRWLYTGLHGQFCLCVDGCQWLVSKTDQMERFLRLLCQHEPNQRKQIPRPMTAEQKRLIEELLRERHLEPITAAHR